MSPWRRNWWRLISFTAGAVTAVYLTIVVIDPFDTLFLSPPLERAPVATNQRFSFPALARSGRFDSAIIGTSTTRLLRPRQLDRLTGERFVNLSMNGATAFEQGEIAKLFARRHPEAGAVIVGLDSSVYCGTGDDVARLTFRPFPEWMYDRNRYNDLFYHFSGYALENAWRQFLHVTGLKESPYGLDGYTNFLPPRSEYDIRRFRSRAYGDPEGGSVEPVVPPVRVSDDRIRSWRFPAHRYLRTMLGRLPASSRKILVFVPLHVAVQPQPGSEAAVILAECKRRITKLAEGYENSVVLDFMISSAITRRDENYWDVLHYNLEVAEQFGRLIVAGGWHGQRGGTRYRTLGAMDIRSAAGGE